MIGTHTYQLRSGFWITAPEHDHISRYISRGDFYERTMLQHISSRYALDTVLDIGAHIGNHAIFFAGICRAKHVFAFEPDYNNYKLLALNIVQNQLSSILPMFAAVGNLNGFARMEKGPDGNTGMARVVEAVEIKDFKPPLTTAHVPILKLDSLTFDKISLIKIDVEGLGLEVLRGAHTQIQMHRPYAIFVECATSGEHEEVSQYMEQHGYVERGCWNATPTYEFVRR